MNAKKYNKKYAQIEIKEEINDKINELIKFNNEITIEILELKNSTKSRSNNKKIDQELETIEKVVNYLMMHRENIK